jgi:hypothetical protein
MAIAPLNRRTVLQTGAISACGLAFAGLLQPADAVARIAPLPETGPALVSGMLSGWVTVELHHSAVIRFAHIVPGVPPVELGEPVRVSLRGVAAPGLEMSGLEVSGAAVPDQMRRATAASHHLARAMLARSWNVPIEDCVIGPRHIMDRRAGHRIGYSVWVDLA